MSDVAAVIAPMRQQGRSLAQISDHLNDEGYVTRRGKTWSPTQVLRVLSRLPKT